MKIVFSLLIIISTLTSFSQIENNYYSINSQYLFNTFNSGEIYFKDGNIVKGELNYNVLVDEFHYIQNGILKTFTENDIKIISKIIIADKQFIFKDRITYEVINSSKTLLLLKRAASQDNINQNTGAYGTSPNTSANKKIYTLSHTIGHEMEKDALVNIKNDKNSDEINIRKSFYIIYNNDLYHANKRTIYKLFRSKDIIKVFIKKEKIDMKVAKDLIRLILFCENLSN